jgi:hypothetical protein
MPFPLYIPTSYPSLSFSNPLAITFSEFLDFDVSCQGQPVHKVELPKGCTLFVYQQDVQSRLH